MTDNQLKNLLNWYKSSFIKQKKFKCTKFFNIIVYLLYTLYAHSKQIHNTHAFLYLIVHVQELTSRFCSSSDTNDGSGRGWPRSGLLLFWRQAGKVAGKNEGDSRWEGAHCWSGLQPNRRVPRRNSPFG